MSLLDMTTGLPRSQFTSVPWFKQLQLGMDFTTAMDFV